MFRVKLVWFNICITARFPVEYRYTVAGLPTIVRSAVSCSPRHPTENYSSQRCHDIRHVSCLVLRNQPRREFSADLRRSRGETCPRWFELARSLFEIERPLRMCNVDGALRGRIKLWPSNRASSECQGNISAARGAAVSVDWISRGL